MPFAILRTAKLKTAASINGVAGHNSRTRKTRNADPERKVENILNGGPDLHATVIEKIETAGAKYRSNSVLAQEVFLSASPEYFRPGQEDQAGTYDNERMDQWKKRSVSWLQEQFKDNMVDCKLHLDESTPHIHAVVVPLTEDKRLSARDVFSKITLRKMQTSYAKKLEPLGLQRGIKNSKAKHTDIKQYYGAVNSAEQIHTPGIDPPEKMIRKSTREKYAVQLNKELGKEFKKVAQQAENALFAQKKLKEYQHTAIQISGENYVLKEKLKLAADNARSTPLVIVLKRAGLEIDPRDKNQWLGAGYRISVKDQKFYDHNNEKGGGGAIDLVKHLNQCDYKNAVAWLGQNVSSQEAAKCIRAEAARTAVNFSKGGVQLHMPSPEWVLNGELKRYLEIERALDPRLTDPLIDQDLIYATRNKGHANAVFVCRNEHEITGAELKGLSGNFSGMALGSQRGKGAFTIGNPKSDHIVIVESAIDAISYLQLSPESCFVLSTAGVTSKPPLIQELKNNYRKLTIAYDNDATGRMFANKLRIAFPVARIEHPGRKDWNAEVKNPSAWMRLRQTGLCKTIDRGFGR